MPPPSHLYLSPGMFGFARLASFEYFEHLVRALEERFAARGRQAVVRVVEVHPTASIRRRAVKLAAMVADTCGDAGHVHVVGHSTGGLDARLVASPNAALGAATPGGPRPSLSWLGRLRSITSMNTPHHGTPLASFFATVSGQRLLYAISALTVTALKLGAPPLAATSAVVAALGQAGRSATRDRSRQGFELDVVDRAIESLILVLDEASSRDLRAWLRLLRDDQGAIVQIMPEAMDLFGAGVENRPGVRYQCVASYAPPIQAVDWIGALRSPWRVASTAVFAALYNIAARQDPRYPCAAHDGSGERQVRALLGEAPPAAASDGIVPLYSQIWGELLWVGKGDHLDVVGHFPGREGHVDWLSSGARFSRVRFDVVVDRIVEGMILAEELADA